jgi:hypothetical protein
MSRWVFLLGVGVTLVAVAFVVTCQVLEAQPGVTEANFKRIKEGMSLAEVEAILGGRATSEVNFHRVLLRLKRCCFPVEEYDRCAWRRKWTSPRGTVTIMFGIEGTVTESHFEAAPPSGPLDWVRE